MKDLIDILVHNKGPKKPEQGEHSVQIDYDYNFYLIYLI